MSRPAGFDRKKWRAFAFLSPPGPGGDAHGRTRARSEKTKACLSEDSQAFAVST
jgi:hypothetical protein